MRTTPQYSYNVRKNKITVKYIHFIIQLFSEKVKRYFSCRLRTAICAKSRRALFYPLLISFNNGTLAVNYNTAGRFPDKIIFGNRKALHFYE